MASLIPAIGGVWRLTGGSPARVSGIYAGNFQVGHEAHPADFNKRVSCIVRSCLSFPQPAQSGGARAAIPRIRQAIPDIEQGRKNPEPLLITFP